MKNSRSDKLKVVEFENSSAFHSQANGGGHTVWQLLEMRHSGHFSFHAWSKLSPFFRLTNSVLALPCVI